MPATSWPARIAAWLEPASTNYIRNNTNIGAVAGTVTLPNNWSVLTSAGLSSEVLALGTLNGIPFMDLRIFGTANTAGPFQLADDAPSDIAAVVGETWTPSAFVQTLNMTAPQLSIRLRLREDSSTGTNLAVRRGNDAHIGQSGAICWYVNSATAYVRPGIALGVTNGATYDFTLRMGLVSLEKQEVETTPILSPNNVTSRNADYLTFDLPARSWRTTWNYGSNGLEKLDVPGGLSSHQSTPLAHCDSSLPSEHHSVQDSLVA